MKELQRNRILDQELEKLIIRDENNQKIVPGEAEQIKCKLDVVACSLITLLSLDNLEKQTGNKVVSTDVESLAKVADNIRYNCPRYEHAGNMREACPCHRLGPRMRNYIYRGKKGNI